MKRGNQEHKNHIQQTGVYKWKNYHKKSGKIVNDVALIPHCYIGDKVYKMTPSHK